ncbi:calcium-binding protein [Jatrophihabitans sp. DSM 45814]
MNIQTIFGKRQIGLAAAALLTVGGGLAIAGAADAAPIASASVANNTLTINGTSGDDDIVIGLAADNPNTLVIDFGNGTLPQSFDRTTFNTISAFLGRGDDQFHENELNGRFVEEALIVDGGAGNDTIVGGSGNDTLSGGAGDDNIQGGAGNDVIFGNAGNDVIDGNVGTDTEILGAGADTAVWNPGEGNDVVDGSAGVDTLAFNGSNANEIMALSANGRQAVLTRDVGGIRMDLDNVEHVKVAAVGGADSVTINDLTGTDVRSADVDLSAQGVGDGQADTVTVNGTNKADRIYVAGHGSAADVRGLVAATHVTGGETADHLQVNSLGGNDTVAIAKAAGTLMSIAADLGTGQR